jgi:hypothetical protein
MVLIFVWKLVVILMYFLFLKMKNLVLILKKLTCFFYNFSLEKKTIKKKKNSFFFYFFYFFHWIHPYFLHIILSLTVKMNEGKESMKSQETFHCCNIFFLFLFLFFFLLLLLPANYCIKAPISFTKIK